MAFIAIVGQNGLNIPGEINRSAGGGRQNRSNRFGKSALSKTPGAQCARHHSSAKSRFPGGLHCRIMLSAALRVQSGLGPRQKSLRPEAEIQNPLIVHEDTVSCDRMEPRGCYV